MATQEKIGEKIETYTDSHYWGNLCKSLYKMMKKDEFCDVNVKVKDTLFPGHMCILSASSSYFNCAVKEQVNGSHQVIKLPFAEKTNIYEIVLDYIYLGKVTIAEAHVRDLLAFSATLQLQGLVQHCSDFLEKLISFKNCFEIQALADLYGLSSLSKVAYGYILANMLKVIEEDEILRFSYHKLESLLGNRTTPLTEEAKLHTMCRWIAADGDNRKWAFDKLLQKISWERADLDVFYQVIQSEALLVESEVCLYFLFKHMNDKGKLVNYYEAYFKELENKFSTGALSDQSALSSEKSQDDFVKTKSFARKSTEQTSAITASSQQQAESKSPTNNETCAEENLDSLNCHSNSDLSIDETTPVKDYSAPVETTQVNDAFSDHIVAAPKIKIHKASYAKKKRPGLKLKIPSGDQSFKLLDTNKELNDQKTDSPADSKQADTRKRKGSSVAETSKTTQSKETEKSKGPRRSKRKRVPVKKFEDAEFQLFEDLQDDPVLDELNDESFDGGALNLSDIDDFTDNDNVLDAFFTSNFKGQEFKTKQEDDTRHFESVVKTELEPGVVSTKDGSGLAGTKLLMKKQVCDRLECEACGYSSYSEQRMEQHKMQHEKEDLRHMRFNCAKCQFLSSSNSDYFQHMQSHFPSVPYRCTVENCKYHSKTFAFMLHHHILHSGERPFVCALCNFAFKSRKLLLSHLSSHTGSKPFQCTVCDRRFATKGTLEQHKVVHSDIRPYLCDTCGFSTKFQSHLVAHKRTHTGDVFKCQFEGCTYSTPKRSQLACHMRSHMNIRQYVCPVCSRAFIEKSHLVRHERIHREQNPYVCSQCTYSSTRRDKLKEHISKYHGPNTPADKKYKARKARSTAVPEKALPERNAVKSQQKQADLQYRLTQAERRRKSRHSINDRETEDSELSLNVSELSLTKEQLPLLNQRVDWIDESSTDGVPPLEPASLVYPVSSPLVPSIAASVQSMSINSVALLSNSTPVFPAPLGTVILTPSYSILNKEKSTSHGSKKSSRKKSNKLQQKISASLGSANVMAEIFADKSLNIVDLFPSSDQVSTQLDLQLNMTNSEVNSEPSTSLYVGSHHVENDVLLNSSAPPWNSQQS